jgi:hypothetical protein
MSNDELRAALARLADEAPFELRRSEQVWRRYRRARRRVVGAGVGTVAALVATVALVAPSGGGSQGLIPVQPRPAASRTPAATRSAGTGGTAAGAGASASASAPGTASPSALVPTGDGAATVTAAPPRGDGREPAAGVEMFMSPSIVRPNDQVIANVFPYAADNGLDTYTLDWGDGTKPIVYPDFRGRCQLDDGRVVFGRVQAGGRHTYKTTGTYTVTVTTRFGGCGRPEQVRTKTAQVVVGNDLGAPPLTSGVRVQLDPADPADPPSPGTRTRAVVLDAGGDSNTVVGFVIVEWGDGTSSVLRRAVPDWCAVPAPPDPDWPAYAEHTYARRGSYPVWTAVTTMTCRFGKAAVTGYDDLRMAV